MNLSSKLASFAGTVALGAIALASMAITMSGGVVTFETADSDAVTSSIGTGVQNLWAGFKFLLPYLGLALGIGVVIGGVYALVRKLRGN